MKKVFFFFCFLFFFATTPKPATACLDMFTRYVGKSNPSPFFETEISTSLYHPVRYLSVTLCFTPKVDPKESKTIKFFGIRVPGVFNITSKQIHKIIALGSQRQIRYGMSGKVIVFHYKSGTKYCVKIKPRSSVTTYFENGEYKKKKLNKWEALAEYHLRLNTNKHIKFAIENIARRDNRPGVTIGSEFFSGRSGAKGGCGTTPVPWANMAKNKKPTPPPKARIEDFE